MWNQLQNALEHASKTLQNFMKNDQWRNKN